MKAKELLSKLQALSSVFEGQERKEMFAKLLSKTKDIEYESAQELHDLVAIMGDVEGRPKEDLKIYEKLKEKPASGFTSRALEQAYKEQLRSDPFYRIKLLESRINLFKEVLEEALKLVAPERMKELEKRLSSIEEEEEEEEERGKPRRKRTRRKARKEDKKEENIKEDEKEEDKKEGEENKKKDEEEEGKEEDERKNEKEEEEEDKKKEDKKKEVEDKREEDKKEEEKGEEGGEDNEGNESDEKEEGEEEEDKDGEENDEGDNGDNDRWNGLDDKDIDENEDQEPEDQEPEPGTSMPKDLIGSPSFTPIEEESTGIKLASLYGKDKEPLTEERSSSFYFEPTFENSRKEHAENFYPDHTFWNIGQEKEVKGEEENLPFSAEGKKEEEKREEENLSFLAGEEEKKEEASSVGGAGGERGSKIPVGLILLTAANVIGFLLIRVLGD